MTLLPLWNPIQPYAWGSRTALAEIQGREAPADGPEAELWIGDHPSAPSRLRDEGPGAGERLDRWLAEHPEVLGASRERFGERLPFLLKILAAAHPLSLQVHPDAERAREVFEGSGPGNPYVDDRHKPEILCALTPFRALRGFLPFEQSADLVGPLAEALPLGDVDPGLGAFAESPSPATLRALLRNLLTLDAGHRRSFGRGVLAALTVVPPERAAVVQELAEHFPDDPLLVAPLLLHILHLEPGEALFTGPGVLHSYLGGTGVELMASSDNVLRAGLTEKPVQVEELLHVTRFEPTEPQTLRPALREGSAFAVYPTDIEELELGVLRWDEARRVTEPVPRAAELFLCTEGSFTLTDGPVGPQSGRREEITLGSGEAALLGADSGGVLVEGKGELFRAGFPAL